VEMEKEKRKGRPNRAWMRPIGFALVLSFVCAVSFFYYIAPGHSMSDFSRFESAEEVVAFLHEPFDLQVTTREEILAFMAAHSLEDCQARRAIVNGNFADELVNENGTKILDCTVPTWFALGGLVQGYRIEFWITKENLLEYIEADSYCSCP
jgi:hypothetical protein